MPTILPDVTDMITAVSQLADDCRKHTTRIALIDLVYAMADAQDVGITPADALFAAVGESPATDLF